MRRRDVLRIAAAVPLLGCERVWSGVARELGQRIPDHVDVATASEIDPAFHLLSRAAHGPWPGDLERVRQMGTRAWIEEQLAPSSIDDRACDVRARRYESIHLEPNLAYEMEKHVIRRDMERHTLLRAVYSQRQLLEVMVGFWTDHFNVDANKSDVLYFLPAHDRAIRKHALRDFRDLVRASITSGAMLLYLDGAQNDARAPNENHARELLELHTLGVKGGYMQQDVRELARAMTGWRVNTTGWSRGKIWLDPARHDSGKKTVLGAVIESNDIDRIVEIVTLHPSTPLHIAEKLARKLVADDPPRDLVEDAARAFPDIQGMVRAILISKKFEESRAAKIKRPFHFVASAFRALGADTHAHEEELETLSRLGQSPFSWPTPDGFPDRAERWTGTLLWRWNFAFALARGPMVNLDELVRALGDEKKVFAHLVGRAPNETEKKILDGYADARADRAETIALALSSPAFQRC